jgi:ESCRT-I complex subunit VPS28
MITISLDEEVRLYTTNAEREKYNLLATLFGIIVSIDYLERAYVRDSITAAEYAPPFAPIQSGQPTKNKILSSMHKAAITIQDNAEARRR